MKVTRYLAGGLFRPLLLSCLCGIVLTACLGASKTATPAASSDPVVTPPAANEAVVQQWSFAQGVEQWAGMAGAKVAAGNGVLSVTGRVAPYDGAGVALTGVSAQTLYVFRTQVRPATSTTLTLNLKIGSASPVYRQVGRSAANAGSWTPVRFFLWLSASDLASGVTLYWNADNQGDFDLAGTTLSRTAYVAPTAAAATSSFAQAASFRSKGINFIAYSDVESDDPLTFMNYSYYNFDQDDFPKVASWGFNTVRIALWHKYFATDLGWQWLDTVIGWAKAANVKVMLDLHSPQGGGFQGPNNITAFWSSASDQARFVELWTQIAARYKNEPAIVAYDLMNEPCPPNQAQYVTLVESTIAAIRQVDPNHIINIENTFAADAQPFHIAGATNVQYDFHFYDPWNAYTAHTSSVYGSGTLTATLLRSDFAGKADYYRSRGLPLMVSEFGQRRAAFPDRNPLGWISDTVSLFNEYGASYVYFSYKGNEFGVYDSTNALTGGSNVNQSLVDWFKLNI